MKKENKNLCFGMGLVFTIASFFVVGIFVMSVTMQPLVENQVIKNRERVLISLGDAPWSDASKFYYVMIYSHSGDPGTTYASNLSNATAYEYLDSGDGEMTGTTPKSTAFDIVVKVGVTDSDGHNGSAWQDAWHYVHLTCSDLSIGANSNMTQVIINEGGDYGFFHYYLNNGDSGYQIVEDEVFNITSVKFYVYREV